MSKATETLHFLASFNSWRRGDESIEQPDPAEIGAVIDDAVNLLRKYDGLLRAAEDMLSTYRHDDKTVIVTAERQEAWSSAIDAALAREVKS